ncbi:peptidylprolyl isomerase [Stappia sp.]|uniref:peptidylprolyl isomerase n=1 Tax=Stappia sp. TaxID=1870903 RepID=UPI003A99074E
MANARRTVIAVKGVTVEGEEHAAEPFMREIVVNGERLPVATIGTEAQNHPVSGGSPRAAWQRAAEALAIRTLLLQEAARRDIVTEQREVGPGRYETDEEARIRALLDLAVEAALPEDAAVRQEWERDPSRFRSPPLWEVSHILCACEQGDKTGAAIARDRARRLCAEALADPAGFARLAARESDCGSRSGGGALGQLGPGDTVPEFEAALRLLGDGEITAEPVATRHGYHVIRLDALAEGKVLPYEAVAPKIAAAMEKASWARAARDFVAELVATAEISGVDLSARSA